MYDIVGRSDRLFSRQYVNKNEDLILIKYQTPLKSKYYSLFEQKLAFVAY